MSIRTMLSVFLSCLFFTVFAQAETDEKALLLNSTSFGTLTDYQSKKEKKPVNTKLSVYNKTVMTTGNQRDLSVNYNEVWRIVDKDRLTAQEVERFKGQLNIIKLYWRDNKIQALAVERYFVDEKKHFVTDIFDREKILKTI